MAYATINPYTGETLATFPDATDDEVRAAIGAAHEAFLNWRQSSLADRAAILQRAADLLRHDSDAYAKLLTLEMGKLFAEAKAEVELVRRRDIWHRSGRGLAESVNADRIFLRSAGAKIPSADLVISH